MHCSKFKVAEGTSVPKTCWSLVLLMAGINLMWPNLGEGKPERETFWLGGNPACACLLMDFMLLGQELPATKQLDNFCATKPACLMIG